MNPRTFQRHPTLLHRPPDTRKFASAGAAFAAGAPFAIFPSSTLPAGSEVTTMLHIPGLGSFLAWYQSARILADLLTGLFSGVPKLLKTQEAVGRLSQSALPQFQQLARNLGIWVKNGIPLSTGDPKLRAQLTDWIRGTLTASGLGLTAAQVPIVNSTLWRLFASETALSARALDALVQSFQRVNAASETPVSTPRPPTPQPSFLPAVFRPPVHPRGPLSQFELATIPFPVGPLEFPQAAEVGTEVIEELGHIGEQLAKSGLRALGRKLRGQPTPQPQPQHPLLELSQDGTQFKIPCPSCDRIARQRGELQQEIETETQQDISKRLDSIQQQLDRLHQLEGQPTQFRDIPKELGQKQQLAEQLDQLQREAQGGGQPQLQPPPPSGQPMKPPPPRTGHVQLVCPPGTHPCVNPDGDCEQFGDCVPDGIGPQPAPQSQQPQPTPRLQFCVGCADEEDAILFLNGEPSACSVIPGSTKQLGG